MDQAFLQRVLHDPRAGTALSLAAWLFAQQLPKPRVALLATALFALHPLQVELLCYVSVRGERGRPSAESAGQKPADEGSPALHADRPPARGSRLQPPPAHARRPRRAASAPRSPERFPCGAPALRARREIVVA